MIKFITTLYLVTSICTARPNGDVDTQNVVSVPPNCPSGQEWVNGQCRDVWKSVTAETSNVVSVPTNCPEGQEYVNGQCRDVWFKNNLRIVDIGAGIETQNVVTVPPNCPPGQQWVNGQCRDIWKMLSDTLDTIFSDVKKPILRDEIQIEDVDSNDSPFKNVISVPNQCPSGYKPDALGVCRPLLSSSFFFQ